MLSNRSIPRAIVIPVIAYPDVNQAAAWLCDAFGFSVRLRIGEGTLTLLAQTAEVGDDEAPLSATVKGDDVQIAFNARYMLDALSALDSDEVILSFNGSLQPGVIRPVGSDDYLCIIMPVRVA